MGNATQRREKKRANQLTLLAISQPSSFQNEWKKMLEDWSSEILMRAREYKGDYNHGKTNLPIFDVLKKAERILGYFGEDAKRLVGQYTRERLRHECSEAVAGVMDRRLYWLVNCSSNEQKMRDGGFKPPR